MTVLRSFAKSGIWAAYCLFIGWFAYKVVDYWAAGVLAERVEHGLPIYDGILTGSEDVLDVRPHYNGQWKIGDVETAIRTNAHGFREDIDFADADVDVAFMGDSFTFGHGVNVEERYSNVVAAAYPALRVVSLSYNNGFQPEHYEYFLQRHTALHPKHVFVGLYLGNDLEADLRETDIARDASGAITHLALPYRTIYQHMMVNAPNYRYAWLSDWVAASSIGKLVGMQINASSKLRKLLVTVQTNANNSLATEQGKLDALNYRAITALKGIARIVTQRGGQVHVLLIPQNFIVGEAEHPHIARSLRHLAEELRASGALRKAIMSACVAEGLECHDLAPHLTPADYLVQDGHWNAAGHRKMGEYAAGVIRMAPIAVKQD